MSEELPKPDAFTEACLGVYIDKVREAFAKTREQRTALADALKQAMAERDELRALVLASRPALERGERACRIRAEQLNRAAKAMGGCMSSEADLYEIDAAQLRTLSAYGVGT